MVHNFFQPNVVIFIFLPPYVLVPKEKPIFKKNVTFLPYRVEPSFPNPFCCATFRARRPNDDRNDRNDWDDWDGWRP